MGAYGLKDTNKPAFFAFGTMSETLHEITKKQNRNKQYQHGTGFHAEGTSSETVLEIKRSFARRDAALQMR